MRTESEVEALLQQALAPDKEPEEPVKEALREKLTLKWNSGSILSSSPIERAISADWRKHMGYKKKISVAAAAAVCVLAMSATAVAAVRYLTRDEILEEMKDVGATETFEAGEVLEINQTQEAGDYRFTLYGIATREALIDNALEILGGEGSCDEGNTFAVVSIERKDGTPLPSTSSPEYGELEFFISPLIQGLEPWFYNMASMGGSYGEMERNGVLYRIVECDDIALFADRELYLCITDSSFYKKEAFSYNETDGTIAPNVEYQGINVLFDLPIDGSRADAELAAQYLERLNISEAGTGDRDGTSGIDGVKQILMGNDEYAKLLSAEIQNGRLESGIALVDMIVNAELAKGMEFESTDWGGEGYIEQIPLDRFLHYGVLEEASVKEATLFEDGTFSYSYSGPDGDGAGGWGVRGQVEWVLKDSYGMVDMGRNIELLPDSSTIKVHLLYREEDGTITGMVYTITEESATAAIVVEE